MSLQKKYSRKTMAFLTPQSRRIQSPGTRLSIPTAEKDPEHLLGSLLNDPIKRALLMEVLSHGSPKADGDKDKRTEKKTQKFKFESPSALCRRRALENMRLTPRLTSESSANINNKGDQIGKSVPFQQILKGVVAYVEIISNYKDRSSGAKALMQGMGAKISDVLNREITHVIFKDGSFKTYQKAKLLKVHLVSVLWIEAVRKSMRRVPEQNYPALGNSNSNANASFLCQQFQKDYADVIEEELNKSKNLNVTPQSSHRFSEDVIDTSQNDDIQPISIKNYLEKGHAPVTPNSLLLDTTPELTSDSETECFQKTTFLKKLSIAKRSLKYNGNSEKNENGKIECDNRKDKANDHIRISDEKTPGTQTEELSSLRISTDSAQATDKSKTPSQKILNYNNVTERKKNKFSEQRDNINILNNIVLIRSPQRNYSDQDKADAEKLDATVIKSIDENLERLRSDIDNENIKLSSNVIKKTGRKLYNVDDPIIMMDELNNLTENISENNVNSLQKENTNYTIFNSIKQNDDNLGTLNNPKLNTKHVVTPPRGKSTRLFQNKNAESPPKRSKRNTQRNNVQPSETTSDSDDEFETSSNEESNNKIKMCPKENDLKQLKITSKATTLSKTTSSNLSNCGSPASNMISSMKKCMIILNPIVDSSDEFVPKETPLIPNTINNNVISPTKRSKEIPKSTIISSDLSNDKTKTNADTIAKTQRNTPAKPMRRSTRLLSLNETQNTNVVQRRSTLDFVPKVPISKSNSKNTVTNRKLLTPKNKLLKKVSIVCTRYHSTEVQVFQQIVKKLGVFFVEDEVTDKTTHLVAAESRRTINLLRAIARGCWVLKSEWLYGSLEAGSWLPEEDFELTEFSIAVQKARQERQAFGARFSMDIFENCGSIYISKATNPRCSDLQELVRLCKGSLTTTARNADIVIGEYVTNKSCVTVNWIMDSISFYKRKSLRNYIIEAPDND